MTNKNKTIVIICISLLVILTWIQSFIAMPYLMRHGINEEIQREHLLIVFFLGTGFTAVFYTLFRNIEKKHKFIRGVLIYLTVCGCIGMVCCLVAMLLR